MKESILQKQCEGLLQAKKIYYLHLVTAISRFVSGSLITLTVPQNKGFPDLMIFLPYEPIFVELKVGRNSLTKEQREVKERLVALGYDYFVCRSFQEFENIIIMATVQK